MDTRQARSQATQNALMRAAEKLIAERGIANVSIREIVTTAGQKNESALQYHFGNLPGLVEAIQQQRALETQARGMAMLEELLAGSATPTLRDLCILMVRPPFELARSSPGFRRYIKAFGHELATTESSAFSRVTHYGGGGTSGQKLGALIRKALPHLEDAAYQLRMEAAVRLCASSMYHQARQKQAFRGNAAELFVNSLIDALVGLFGAPVSAETRAVAAELQKVSRED